jgi:hypothetical protein
MLLHKSFCRVRCANHLRSPGRREDGPHSGPYGIHRSVVEPILRGLVIVALAFVVLTSVAAAQNDARPAPKKANAAVPRPDDEDVALAFVRENHPPLAELLAQLKPMKPTEYQKAIRELAQVSRTLGDLKQRDPKRYESGLNAWKARSRVELLSARLASGPGPNAELESQLRHAIEDQVDQEILRLKFEREMAEERLKRVKENLERAESHHDQMVQNRYKIQLKAAEKAREKSTTAAGKLPPETKPKSPKDEKGKNQP